jgi:hypothetical protein
MPNKQYRAGKPWTCPACGRQYRIAKWYSASIFGAAILITVFGCFLVGLRGTWLVAGSFLAFIPVLLLCTFISDSVLPVPLENFHGSK